MRRDSLSKQKLPGKKIIAKFRSGILNTLVPFGKQARYPKEVEEREKGGEWKALTLSLPPLPFYVCGRRNGRKSKVWKEGKRKES